MIENETDAVRVLYRHRHRLKNVFNTKNQNQRLMHTHTRRVKICLWALATQFGWHCCGFAFMLIQL